MLPAVSKLASVQPRALLETLWTYNSDLRRIRVYLAMTPQLLYRDVGAQGIDGVRPLWEKLRAHHAGLSPRFGEAVRVGTFDVRKRKLLEKGNANGIRVDLVLDILADMRVSYCISTVSDDGVGEIDSIYVEERFRGIGI
ncbi:MAG: hypothetical protein ACREU2_01340, partial [Steroidobacteraceae bacterium]